MSESSYATGQPRGRNALAFAAVLLLGGAFGLTKLASLDLPLALANGHRVLGGGGIPRTNVASWVRPDFPYVNDKWGFDVLVSAADAALGDAGLHALTILLGAAMAALLFALCRRSSDGWRAAGLAALGSTMLGYRLFLRAEWMSYLFVAATLLLLPGLLARERRSEIAFLALVPVAAACHPYWFLGPVIVLVAAAAERSARTFVAGLAGVAVAAISPFGFDNVLHPFRVAGQVAGTELTDAIGELRAPFAAGAPVTCFHVLAIALVIASVAAIVAHLRARRWSDAAVLATLVAVSARFDRNLAMLGLAVPLVAAAPIAPRLRAALCVAGAFGVVTLVCAAMGVTAFLAGREPGFGWQDGLFPARLAASLGPSRAGARYVNDLSIGSFLVRARGEAFIDGNTHGYPREFLAEYRRALTGEIGVEVLDAAYPNDGWVLRHNAPTTREMILGLFLGGDHAPIEWDDVATRFARMPDDPEAADRRWRRWLSEAYLPAALEWFPSDEECRFATKADPDWGRRAAVLCPWRVRYYDEMVRRFTETGDTVAAARCLRYASRFPR